MILKFTISRLFSDIWRNLLIIVMILFTILTMSIFAWCYQNFVKALKYYSYESINERRFTIYDSQSPLRIFEKNSKGLDKAILNRLDEDRSIEKHFAFTLVEVPVMVKFSIFTFGLETDFPIIAVTDSFFKDFHSDGVKIGLPRAMIDFYNLQFAGSSSEFPRVRKEWLLGQKLGITFGKSKLFPGLARVGDTFEGKVVTIDDDIPLGVILSDSVTSQQLKSVGYELGNPFKVVAYMKKGADVEKMKDEYASYYLEFDSEKMKAQESRIDMLRLMFMSLMLLVAGVMGILLIMLFLGLSRENRPIFAFLNTFGLRGWKSKVVTLLEPTILVVISSVVSILVTPAATSSLRSFLQYFLTSHGVMFRISPVGFADVILITSGYCAFLFLCVVVLDFRERRGAATH